MKIFIKRGLIIKNSKFTFREIRASHSFVRVMSSARDWRECIYTRLVKGS